MFSVPSRGETPARRCNRRGLVGTPSVPISTPARGSPGRAAQERQVARRGVSQSASGSGGVSGAPTCTHPSGFTGPSLFPGPGHAKSKGSAAPTASNLGDDLGDFVERLLHVRHGLPYSSA